MLLRQFAISLHLPPAGSFDFAPIARYFPIVTVSKEPATVQLTRAIRALLKLVSVGLVLLFGVRANAQVSTDPVCVQSANIPLPPGDLPPAGTTPGAGCDPWDMYYKSTEITDFRVARYCAYSNLGGNDDWRDHID